MRKEALLLILLLAFAGCIGVALAPIAFAGEPPCQDAVRAEVVANNINVFHDQAEWNCCATIKFDLTAHADTLDLYESETFDVGPCHCLCCFDLATTITGVAPGTYLVRVLAAVSGELFGEVWVEVPGEWTGVSPLWSATPGTGACAADVGGTLQSPCGGWTTSVKEATTTWGHIKAVFR